MSTEAAWRVKAGQRERRSFDVNEGADTVVDVTGWSVDAKIRTRPGGLALHTFPADHISIDGGEVTLTIPAPTSAAWTWATGWYRCVLTNPDSPDPDDPQSSRVLEGVFVVDPD